jgi:hypothetical protein
VTLAYNPLDKLNLARSIENELLRYPPLPLSEADRIVGAGIYAIYYSGPFASYAPIRSRPEEEIFESPIYVGKAIPKGGRKGGLTKDATIGRALADRLRQHAGSVSETINLELSDFHFRHLVVEDVWIPLGENILIENFKPVWNRAIDGFGNKDPGRRRATQFRSPWDVLHPGRRFADKLAESGLTAGFLTQRIDDYLAGRKLARLPKRIAEQIEAERQDAEEASDEA